LSDWAITPIAIADKIIKHEKIFHDNFKPFIIVSV
jgi:hypothetical protein